jgi:hypothetical protein
MWFSSVIDRWDEEAATEDDAHKRDEVFDVGAALAFPDLPATASAGLLSDAVRARMADPRAFYTRIGASSAVTFQSGWLNFESVVRTEDAANNIAGAFVLESDQLQDVVLVIPHWNAPQKAYFRLATTMRRFGYAAAVLTLPYHHQRRRPGSAIADYFVSANLGRTIRAVRQAVTDAIGVIDWLESRGYRRIHVTGASLGSRVAGLVGAVDARVRSSILLLTAGNFAEVVWTGRATRHIAAALRGAITLEELRAIWSIISLEPFSEFYVRSGFRLLVMSAARDTVVLPHLSAAFVRRLRDVAAPVQYVTLPCGHYSIGMLPFSVVATSIALMFLRKA